MNACLDYTLYLIEAGRYLTLDDFDAFVGCYFIDSGNLKLMTEVDARWAGMIYQNSFAILGLKVPKLHIHVHESGSLKNVIG